MKIAITADLHLTTQSRNPERFSALENILRQAAGDGIATLVVAGDLFDASGRNYAEFETICSRDDFRSIRVLVLPGNHDVMLREAAFTAANVEIVSETRVLEGDALKILLAPYKEGVAAGAEIATFVSQLPEHRWVYIGHGDWTDGFYEPNPLEPGVYMPLTGIDIERFKPSKAILGHIHKPMDGERVSYVGSPCAIAINETGKRRFFVLDTLSQELTARTVATDVIYFDEAFIVVPVADEEAHIRDQIEKRMRSWDLTDEEMTRVVAQVRIMGYSTDKRKLLQYVEGAFKGVRLHNDQADLSGVTVAEDVSLAEIAHRTSEWLERAEWQWEAASPGKEEVLLEALHTIYGE